MKKSSAFLLLAVLSAALLTESCKPKCGDANEETKAGLVTEVYSFGPCNYNAYASGAGTVINSAAELSRYKQDSLKFCDTTAIPAIDFSRNTLLGITVSSNACNVGYHREVSKDTATKKFLYTVKVNGCGDCRTKFRSANWVLTDKLPAGYTVNFRVEK